MADKTTETSKPMSKSAVYQELAQATGLERKQVVDVLEALENLMKEQLGDSGPGAFTLFEMIKIRREVTPARKAGSKPNPFKPGEMMEVKPREAQTKMKVVVLKGLKDLI
jgi:hypothetical protein